MQKYSSQYIKITKTKKYTVGNSEAKTMKSERELANHKDTMISFPTTFVFTSRSFTH